MNEQLRIRLTSNGMPLPVVAADGGIVLRGESSAAPRRVVLEFRGFGAPTLTRIRHVQEREGWPSSTFPLNVRVTDDGFTIAGIRSSTLPAGLYDCRLSIDDVRFPKRGRFRVEIDENATVEVVLDATDDPRQVRLTRAIDEFPEGLQRLLTATTSMLDGIPAGEWLNSLMPRASRKACLLNVLAKLAAERTPLLDTVNTIFFADVDRIYTEVTPQCAALVQQLADDPEQPFFAEGSPNASIHFRMLNRANVSRDDYQLRSFRQAGRNSLQVVVGTPLPGRGDRHLAEFDIDLGNPLQDLAGIVVHFGELLDPDRTDHFALREKLLNSAAGEFLTYDIVVPQVDVRVLGV